MWIVDYGDGFQSIIQTKEVSERKSAGHWSLHSSDIPLLLLRKAVILPWETAASVLTYLRIKRLRYMSISFTCTVNLTALWDRQGKSRREEEGKEYNGKEGYTAKVCVKDLVTLGESFWLSVSVLSRRCRCGGDGLQHSKAKPAFRTSDRESGAASESRERKQGGHKG